VKHIKSITEDIKLDINIGDTLLGGRWRNKQVKVKRIGKDKNGQVTINGKGLLKFRVWKDLPKSMKKKYSLKESYEKIKDDASLYLSHLTDDGFKLDIGANQATSNLKDFFMIRIWKPSKPFSGTIVYDLANTFNWSDIEDEINRFISIELSDFTDYEIGYLYVLRENISGRRDSPGGNFNIGGLPLERIEFTLDELKDGKLKFNEIKSFVIGIKEI
jgi:hypothetical protein